MLYSYKIEQLFIEPDMMTFLKLQRLRWAGHIVGLEKDNPDKKLTSQKTFGAGERAGGEERRWTGTNEWKDVPEEVKARRGL
jgi:hypothetical protein